MVCGSEEMRRILIPRRELWITEYLDHGAGLIQAIYGNDNMLRKNAGILIDGFFSQVRHTPYPKYFCIRLSNSVCASFNVLCMTAFALSACLEISANFNCNNIGGI